MPCAVIAVHVSNAAGMTDRLDSIAIFVAVAEQESFAEAARRLNKTPAAVTRAVAALEGELRTRLLNRTTRSVSLTEDGAAYLEVSRRLLAAFSELQSLEAGEKAQPHGLLHVTAPSMFGRLHVLPSIVKFLDRFPLVDVRSLFIDRVVSLVDEGLDVGVRLGELPDSSLKAVRAGEVVMGVYANPAYLEWCGTPQSPQELGEHATISCLAITPIPDRWSFEGARGVGSVAVKPRFIVNTTEAAAQAAASGLGLTYIVSYQAEAHVKSGALQRVLADYEPPPIPIHVLHSGGRFVTTKVRLFIDQVVQDLRRAFG
jgi:DNA-binding transcriptional LysR family regulator